MDDNNSNTGRPSAALYSLNPLNLDLDLDLDMDIWNVDHRKEDRDYSEKKIPVKGKETIVKR